MKQAQFKSPQEREIIYANLNLLEDEVNTIKSRKGLKQKKTAHLFQLKPGSNDISIFHLGQKDLKMTELKFVPARASGFCHIKS